MTETGNRLASLDLIRGLAVLGILTVNVAGFAGPPAATLTPHVPLPASPLDEWSFAAVFVLFEGKMRALFTLLFGAGMAVFIERADAKGRDGEILQMRRLGWLLLFGLLHHYLFWWGDILFIYGLAGIVVLFLRGIARRPLVLGALILFIGWHLTGALEGLAGVIAEERVREGLASADQARMHASFTASFTERIASDLAEHRLGFLDQIAAKLADHALRPLEIAWPSLGETIPLMILGMALQERGFFAGTWPKQRLWAIIVVGLALGLAMTLALLGWLWERHFPPYAMSQALLNWTALAHLLMGLAYAALLVLAAPRIAATWPGRRIAAAGRMAFSNYIATTVLMTAAFYGWGLGFVGTVGHAGQLPFVLLGWAMMLGWSGPWLARFRQGPLEWLWRSLVEHRLLPLRRA